MNTTKRIVFSLAVLVIVLVLLVLGAPLLLLQLGAQAAAQEDLPTAIERYDLASRVALIPSTKVDAVWQRTQARLKHGDFREAVADSDELLSLAPERADVYAARGEAEIQLADWTHAASDFSNVLRLSPENVDAYAARARAELQLEDYGHAAADFGHVLRLSPDRIEAYAGRGTAELQLTDYDKAAADFTAYIDKGGNGGAVFAKRGQAYLALNNLDAAIEDLQMASQEASTGTNTPLKNLAEAYYRRAKVSADKPDYPAVRTDLNAAINADATRPELFSLRAQADLELERYADVMEDSSKAIVLDPNNIPASAVRAYAAALRAERKTLDADVERVISNTSALTREVALAYAARAIANERDDNMPEAIDDATQALRVNGLSPARTALIYVLRASVELEEDGWKAAVDDFSSAEKQVASEALQRTIYSGRGWAYLWLEDYPHARADFSAALRLSPGDAWLYLHRGLTYAEEKSYGPALQDYAKASELDPQNPYVYTNRGIVFAAQKEFAKATADFEKALALTKDEEQQNWIKSYILMTRVSLQSAEADKAAKNLDGLLGKSSGGTAAQRSQQFQTNFQAARTQLKTLQDQVGLMAQQYAEAEQLKLPDWYTSYANRSRRSLELMSEGFTLIDKLWTRTNTLLSVLPKLGDQLDKATSSTTMSGDTLKLYGRYLDNRDYAAARQLTQSMRDEFSQYQAFFQQAYRDSGLDFVQDAVQFFAQQVELTKAMDDLTTADQNFDRAGGTRALDRLKNIDAEIARLAKRMGNWDAELTRWMAQNIQPLVNSAEAKFDEADALNKEAAAIFDEGRHRVVVKQPRKIMPPGIQG